jgi:hypothetical protein
MCVAGSARAIGHSGNEPCAVGTVEGQLMVTIASSRSRRRVTSVLLIHLAFAAARTTVSCLTARASDTWLEIEYWASGATTSPQASHALLLSVVDAVAAAAETGFAEKVSFDIGREHVSWWHEFSRASGRAVRAASYGGEAKRSIRIPGAHRSRARFMVLQPCEQSRLGCQGDARSRSRRARPRLASRTAALRGRRIA